MSEPAPVRALDQTVARMLSQLGWVAAGFRRGDLGGSGAVSLLVMIRENGNFVPEVMKNVRQQLRSLFPDTTIEIEWREGCEDPGEGCVQIWRRPAKSGADRRRRQFRNARA